MTIAGSTEAVVGETTIRVFAIGDWSQPEFQSAICEVSSVENGDAYPRIEDACSLLSQCEQPPDLILLAQKLPGQYSQSEIDRLQQCVPLTRIVVVASSWCEGELRTGNPLAGVIRLYWYELAGWWQAALRRHGARLCPQWSLALDHANAGRWSNSEVGLAAHDSISVLIDADDCGVFETLSSALSAFNVNSTWVGRDDTVPADFVATAGIWDGSQLDETELGRLASFCTRVHGPVVALLDFPRVEHQKQVREVGATAILAKPYIVEELVATLLG